MKATTLTVILAVALLSLAYFFSIADFGHALSIFLDSAAGFAVLPWKIFFGSMTVAFSGKVFTPYPPYSAIGGVYVVLYDSNGTPIAGTTTWSDGAYSLGKTTLDCSKTYRLAFMKPYYKGISRSVSCSNTTQNAYLPTGNDTDGDGIADASDTDDDNDGVVDIADCAPRNPIVPKLNQCVLTVQKQAINMVSKLNEDSNRLTSYYAYFIPGSSFRILCQRPCQIPEYLLKSKTIGVYNARSKLLNLTQIDVLDALKPVDIHLTDSNDCGTAQDMNNRSGFVTGFAGTRKSGGSYICTWQWDNDTILSMNPKYATPAGQDANKNAQSVNGQLLIIHEYSHILFYGRAFASPEGFAKALSLYVAGLWDNSGGETSDFRPITSACDPSLQQYAEDVYNLCTRCGFEFKDISTLLKEIDRIYKSGGGQAVYGKVSIHQMKRIIDTITGKDSVTDCKVQWLAG